MKTRAMWARPLQTAQRKRTKDEADDYLKDGQVFRVKMMARDSADAWRDEMHQHFESKDSMTKVRFPIVDDKPRTADALVLHRPGFRDSRTPEQLNAVAEAYRKADTRDANAWRGDRSEDDEELDDPGAAEVLWRADGSAAAISDLEAAYRWYDEELFACLAKRKMKTPSASKVWQPWLYPCAAPVLRIGRCRAIPRSVGLGFLSQASCCACDPDELRPPRWPVRVPRGRACAVVVNPDSANARCPLRSKSNRGANDVMCHKQN